MRKISSLAIMAIAFFVISCEQKQKKKPTEEKDDTSVSFPAEMVEFEPISQNPLFAGTDADSWDRNIRERGFILHDEGKYKLWYTGYNDSITKKRFVGLALSDDGIQWERFSDSPILEDVWVEDMFVLKHDGMYYMFAEGENDVAHLLISKNGVDWEPKGKLNLLKANGTPLDPGPYGTPTVWVEDGEKYLFYERNDLGIWLAKSDDFKTWTNVQDEPVLKMGPEKYDEAAVAANQIVKYQGNYYMFYHGSDNPDWHKTDVTALWSSNVAVSKDLVHWTKYPGNPIVAGDHSSNIMVFNGKEHILYTTHDQIWRYNPKKSNSN